ncbi:rabphilin-3A-like isoform X2 [Acanthochromis polyacanthus]|uniref:rabphilin-3A-like isoform X2 n=1 Tax=Acanthochromis polyacanthus TaxID=80966 RepID=UPI00223485C6|nr:rabphilin-3A-like isoform X2 [Acanthochromis polyacanthus]
MTNFLQFLPFFLSPLSNQRKRDSSPAAHQEPPAKRPCTTSGSQRGGEEPSRPEVHAAQPERSTSPQPSTSGSLHYPPQPQISVIPPPYTSESDSEYYSDSGVEGDVDTDSDSDFQEERSSNSAVRARTSQQTSTPREEPPGQPGTISGPEPPPPGVQDDSPLVEPISLFSHGGVRVEETGGLPIVHIPSQFSPAEAAET